MSKKRLQEKKKKRREEVAKARVLKRRKVLRDAIKKESRILQKSKEALKGIPINGDLAKRDAEIEAKIRHNLEVLKSLEEAYLKEQEERKAKNELLEAEGHLTLREKMDAIHVKAKEILKDENSGTSS